MTQSTLTRLTSRVDNSTLGGALLYIGALQWFLGILLAEAWDSGYNSRIDYISELGVGSTAAIYNTSVFVLGLCMVLAAYFMFRAIRCRVQSLLLAISGIGAMGLGIFYGTIQPWHSLCTLIAIVFGCLAAISSYKIQSPPVSYVSVILGVMALAAAIIFFPYLGLPMGSTETYLGMAKGSLERWAIYPILAWAMSHGSHMVNARNRE
jgi:hypothetical membrane protein